jgi:hypothetical protein
LIPTPENKTKQNKTKTQKDEAVLLNTQYRKLERTESETRETNNEAAAHSRQAMSGPETVNSECSRRCNSVRQSSKTFIGWGVGWGKSDIWLLKQQPS